MAGLQLTPLFAAGLTFLYLFLAFRVIGARGSLGVNLGDGGDAAMLRRIRAHGNFAEYAPLGLLLMAFVELGGTPAWQVWLVGGLLAVGRGCHAAAFLTANGFLGFRQIGMVLTIFSLLIAASLIVWRSLMGSPV